MWGIDFNVLLADLAENAAAERRASRWNILRLDLTDEEYADWFLGDKIILGRLNPPHALNDFVLFRVAYQWPMGADWDITAETLNSANFSLTEEQEADLVDMAREGLSDGYRPASWFAKVAIVSNIAKGTAIREPLFAFLQETLFGFDATRQGRKRSDGLDRDLVIRRLYGGLVLRNEGNPGGKARAAEIAVAALAKRGVGLTADAVRKIDVRSRPSEREQRLWNLLLYPD